MSNPILDNALNVISNYYNIDIINLKSILSSNSETSNKSNTSNIILPWCNKIFEDKCKAIVFNHGLYTQCKELPQCNKETCKKCEKLKYGHINSRINIEKDKFITKDGKKEVKYELFMNKMNYNYFDVMRELEKNKLDFSIDKSLLGKKPNKGRGRPKKNEELSPINNNSDDLNYINTIKTNDIEPENLSGFDVIEVIEVIIDGKKYYKTEGGVLLEID